ncbi:hypothetical protein A3E95_01840 [Candidatus Nomurabacteria bacterium RIFCSPHIGHO2_12_FULL_44_22b]|nr:MAG: hypothetical protein A3E95_01840 [Candidatus Nomurabacteria bacterium RIFCSPHIGHO2_12_FULL_44_22b]
MANYIEGNNFSGNKKGGIFNAGKDAKITDNDFVNQDVGIINVGKNMHAETNTFRKSNKEKKEGFWTKWWMIYIIYPLIVGLFLLYIKK